MRPRRKQKQSEKAESDPWIRLGEDMDKYPMVMQRRFWSRADKA